MPQIDKYEFAALYRDAHPRLWTLATAILGDRTQAEDVVQDAAITAIHRLADFEKGTNFLAWMSQIVRFSALNRRKTSRNRKALSLDIHKEEGGGIDVVDDRQTGPTLQPVGRDGLLHADQEHFDDHVTAALAELSPERLACLLLRVVYEMSYDELAEMMGIPVGTVTSHVRRAKIAVRKSLGPSEELGSGDRSGEDPGANHG